MGGLATIVDTEIIRRRREIVAVGVDLDGSLTDLHRDEIYDLIGNRILALLPQDLAASLDGKDFKALKHYGNVPIGWYLDRERGYIVLPNSSGEIINARRGKASLPRKTVSREYGEFIELPTPKDTDRESNRFLAICDGFDFVQGTITVALTSTPGLPRRRTLSEVVKAVRVVHDDVQKGFKYELLQNPGKYGLQPNTELRYFLSGLRDRGYKVFLVTSGEKDYADEVLRILRLEDCFDQIITDVKKPGCFYLGHPDNGRLYQALVEMGITSPSSVLYGGDHLFKDVVRARRFGFLTFLRMPRGHIITVERKLEKYGGMHTIDSGSFRTIDGNAMGNEIPKLSNFLYEICMGVGVLTTKVQNLSSILFY